jgi:hypothetical protein
MAYDSLHTPLHHTPHIYPSSDTLLVRPIIATEREAWDALMNRHHYLGFRVIVGESLRYMAFLGDRPVALIGWGAAAFKSRHRDAWIGWEAHLKWRRLRFIANNVRFLILPDVHIPNLASRILGQNLRRLSADWEAAYGHPILIAETFVDTSRFRGTCYKAAGFLPLGETRGFRRNGGKYYLHGQPKTILVRALRPDARQLLSDPFSNAKVFKEEGIMDIQTLDIDGTDGLIEALRSIPDHRKKRGIRHRALSILAVSVCAVLSGAKTYIAIAEWGSRCSQSMLAKLWCPKASKTGKRVPPSEPTLRRFLGDADAETVDKTVNAWLEREVKRPKDNKNRVIALDGKTLKASARKGEKQVHLLSAFLHHQQVVIAQVQVDAKSNEIPAVEPLLKPLDIEGAVVTADAMHTQKDTATFIVQEKKADYFFTVKDNQETLNNDIKLLQLETFPPSA